MDDISITPALGVVRIAPDHSAATLAVWAVCLTITTEM